MKNSTAVGYFVRVIFLAGLLLGSGAVQAAGGDGWARSHERVADRCFSRGKFEKALTLYERAAERAESEFLQAGLYAKAGRLCFMMRRYDASVRNFGRAMSLHGEILGEDDVCDYVDALRYSGKTKQAETVCMRYAYNSVFSRSQRYLNLLEALSMESLSSNEGYTISPVAGASTARSEYWIGEIDGDAFYAVSRNGFNDPGKRFYRNTEYYKVDSRRRFLKGWTKVLWR